MKTEGRTHIQIRVGDKVIQKIIKSVHNDDPAETDREVTERYEEK